MIGKEKVLVEMIAMEERCYVMKKMVVAAVCAIALVVPAFCAAKDERADRLTEMARKELTGNILPFWMKHSVDNENGGFYGALTREGKPVANAEKCLILNARLVWTFASAYRILKDDCYRVLAMRAYDYLCEYFFDKKYGGAYFMLDAKGVPTDTKKFVYGQAFCIYALSEYYRATGDVASRDKAVEIFKLIEKYGYDAQVGGYREMLSRDWTYERAAQTSRINPNPESARTMNTQLHLIEAYTALLRVMPSNALVRTKVREHLNIFLNRIYDPKTRHLKMFFRDDWSSTTDAVSFGHDIEAAWLMTESADVLGDKDMKAKVKVVALAMSDACLKESIEPDGSMIYEYVPSTQERSKTRTWWVQAETVVGFLNAWQLGGEERFLNASLNAFKYIDRYFVDKEYGEWWTRLGDGGKVLPGYLHKVDTWKGPYHNARMCYEILERLNAVCDEESQNK